MLGSNVSTVGGICKAFVQAAEWECESIQIYTTPSRRWQFEPRPREITLQYLTEREKSNVKSVVAHVPFLVNLGSHDESLYTKSIHRLELELRSADELNIDRLILHPGSSTNCSRKEAMLRIANGINTVLSRTRYLNNTILLETMAGQGNTIGSNFEELACIIDQIYDKSRVGICLDTCHLFAAGYELRGFHNFEYVIEKINKYFPLTTIGAFHLNDSWHTIGSKKDRHCSIGDGRIGLPVFHTIVNDNRFEGIPMIVENPSRDSASKQDLDLLRWLKTVSKKYIGSRLDLQPKNEQINLFNMNIINND